MTISPSESNTLKHAIWSLARSLASSPSYDPANHNQTLELLSRLGLTEPLTEAAAYDWETWARPEQLPPPGDWRVWLFQAGRGAGKTRAAAEWFHAQAMSGNHRNGAMVAPTPADARDFMIEGPSGLLHVGRPADRAHWEPSKRRLTWPSGFEAIVYSAEDPDQIRGPNASIAWASEVGAWPAHHAKDAWSNLELSLRIGERPRVVIDTTPRRSSPILKAIREDPGTIVTHSTTYANAANLSPAFVEAIKRKYEGTSLGRQELLGQEIEEIEGALWRYAMLHQVPELPPEAALIAIGVDPSGGATGNEAGIVAAACDRARSRGWVIADHSGQLSPDQWASRAVSLWDELDADAIIVEKNFGGDMCRGTIEKMAALRGGKRPRIIEVTASRGKRVRAEPIAMLYEQQRVEHLPGLDLLEAELCTWDATDGSVSPGRLDSMVWALTWLMLTSRPETWKAADIKLGTPLAASQNPW